MKHFRIRRAWAVVATVALAAAMTPVLLAGPASAATTATVSTEAEFWAAWIAPGITQIDLAASIQLHSGNGNGTCSPNTYPERDQTDPTLLDGHGFTLTQNCDANSVIFVNSGSALLTVQNITITHAGAPTPTVFGNGIASAQGPVTVLNSTITGNWTNNCFIDSLCRAEGGGVFAYGDVIVDGSTISNNRAYNQGGGISSDLGTVTVTNSTVTDNEVNGNSGVGGGIYSNELLTVTNSTVSGNRAAGSGDSVGGGAYSNRGAEIDGSTFNDNEAFCPGECYPAGGGLAAEGGDTTITSSNFLGNSAVCEMYCDNIGGGILTGFGSLTITGSLVSQNSVNCQDSCQADGGGIYADTGSIFDSVNGTHAKSNEVHAAGRGYLATITDSTVSNNVATTTDTPGGDCDCSGAGATINGHESLTVTRSTFSNNTALWDGGALDIWSEITQVRIENSTITGNQSTYDGAIDAFDNDVTTVYSTIDGNIVTAPPVQGTAASSRYGTHGQAQAAADLPRPANLSAGSLTTFGTVFADPQGGPNCLITGSQETATSDGYNYSDDATCGLTAATDKQSASSPMLNVLADNGGPTATMMPYTPKSNSATSPLIDAIPVAACQTGVASGVGTDQRGVARPQILGCDIGAVEVTDGEYQVEAAVVTPKFTG